MTHSSFFFRLRVETSSFETVSGFNKEMCIRDRCQLVAAACLNLSTVRGAVLFGALPLAGGLLVMIPLAWRGLRLAPESATP